MKSVVTLFLTLLTAAQLRAAAPACTATDSRLISRNTSGGSTGGSPQSISDGGRYVAFNSYATDILSTPVNMPGNRNIYVWNRLANTYRAVDNAAPGQGLNSAMDDFAITGNGRFVVFTTQANNVSGSDGNARTDVYIKDLWSNTYDRVTRPDPSTGVFESRHNAQDFAASSDGNAVAFVSSGWVFTTYFFNPSDPDSFNNFHIYVRNRAGGTTQIVTRGRDASNNAQGLNGRVGRPAMAANGALLVFSSDATNLEGFRRTDTKRDVFVAAYNGTQWNVIQRIATQGNGIDYVYRDVVDISPDGRYVGYIADIGNLDYELFIYDRTTGQTIRPVASRPFNSSAASVSLGNDVVAWRDGLDLTGESGYSGGYWYKLPAGPLQRIGREEDGGPACCGSNGYDGAAGGIVISDDGRYAAFSSASPRIDTPDGNGAHDVFVQTMTAAADFTFVCNGLTCQFDAAPTISACAVNQWAWDFGDSTTGNTAAPLHSYLSSGTRDVKLTVTDVNGVTSSVTKKVSVTSALPSNALRYVTVAPCRVWDSRDVVHYPGARKIGSGEQLVVSITNPPPVCSSYPNARAASVNITAVEPTAAGHFLAYATGTPSSSSVMNFTDLTAPRANNAIVPVAADGSITVSPVVLGAGLVHVLVDINGYFTDTPAAGVTTLGFQPLTPCRLYDSRNDIARGPLASGEQRPLPVQGNCGVVSGAAAASLNVIAVGTTAAGHLTLYPNGGVVPTVSNVNFKPFVNIANGARVSLSPTTPDLGTFLVAPGGTSHLVVDTNGYFKSDAPLQFYPITACRALDTRLAVQGPALEQSQSRGVQIRGNCGVPADAKAAMINLTVVLPSADGHLIAYPSGVTGITASSINFSANEPALANGGIVPLSQTIANDLTLTAGLAQPGTVNVLVDVFGYFK